MIYTVTINPSLDYIMIMKEAKLGGLNRSSRELHQMGGKGINVSIVLNNLGVQSTCLGFVAGYVGKELERSLQADGCQTDFIELDNGCTRINVKVKEISGRESELNGNGPVIDEENLEQLAQKVSALQDGDVLVLSGNVPGCVPKDIYGKLAARIEGKNIKLLVDAEKTLLFPTLLYHPFLIKPNLAELCGMLGKTVESFQKISEGMHELQEKGARNVLVSMGKDGACFLGEDGTELYIKAVQGTAINTVGSGDSMVAGFLSCYERGGSLTESACYAVAAGCAGAFSEILPERAVIERLIREIRPCSLLQRT